MKSGQLSLDDTQPNAAVRRRPWVMQRGRWVLLTIIATTSCTLVLTLALFVRAIPLWNADDNASIQVSVDHAGTVRTVETSMDTVGALLSELRIDVPANGAVSHAADTRLSDGMVISVNSPRAVTLIVDSNQRNLNTVLDNPLEILQSAGIAVSGTDKIWVNGALANVEALPNWTIPAHHIRIRQAASLTIIDDGEQTTVVTNAETIGDALFDAGITLYLTDDVNPPLESALSGSMTVHIKRAIPVKLAVDGVVIEARTNAARVEDVLLELNAPLFGLDYVVPPADNAVSEDMTIEIVRVTEEVVARSETIAHERRFQADGELDLDARRVVQQGRDGTREIRSRVRYENGVEVSRLLSETVEVAAPQKHIIAYGTKIVPRTVNTPDGPWQYWRRVCVIATHYQPTTDDNITSRGGKVYRGVIAAKPHIIPYYTKVFVPRYGFGEILDTGAGPTSTAFWIDVGYGPGQTTNWSTRYTWVYHLMPVPAKVNYLLPAWQPSKSYPSGNCGA